MDKFNYQSIYATYFKQFIGIKKGLGFIALQAEWILLEFDCFFFSNKVDTIGITKQQIDEWRATRINDAPSTVYTKYSIIVQFCKYMCKIGYNCYIPRLPPFPPKGKFIPHIFTEENMSDIFRACDQLQLYDKNLSSNLFIIPAIIRLLYGTGLRVSEAISLKNKDIDFDKGCLYIRMSKNGEQRMVPLSESLVQVLKQYLYYRDRMPISNANDSNHHFFVSSIGSSCCRGSIYTWFRKLLTTCGIFHQGNQKGPRLHDLRHTYAVHSLAKMSKSGLDIYYSLPLLSTCLGHKSLQSTEQYVRLTAERYQDLLKDEQGICAFIFPQKTTITNHEDE